MEKRERLAYGHLSGRTGYIRETHGYVGDTVLLIKYLS